MFIIGACSEMCPEQERSLREREKLLHLFEQSSGSKDKKHPRADKNRTVKQFSRSAAGQKAPQPSDIRPTEVLLKTITYLFNEIVTMSNVDWIIIYDFVFDRLRAVRQDMVMQGLNKKCIPLLEMTVRFHAYAAYKLCDEPITKFDHVINHKHLLECLKSLLVLYDEEDNKNAEFTHRSEMEALYLVLNIGDVSILHRAYQLKPSLRTPLMNTGIQLSLASVLGNYIRVCKLIPKLPLLLSCTASLQLPAVRRYALWVMSVAYNSKYGVFPITKLQELLLFDSEADVIKECNIYNIKQFNNKCILFSKATFDNRVNAKSSPLKRSLFVDKHFQGVNVSAFLLGGE